jgi:hypothetical protein
MNCRVEGWLLNCLCVDFLQCVMSLIGGLLLDWKRTGMEFEGRKIFRVWSGNAATRLEEVASLESG